MMARSKTWRSLSSENSAFNKLPIFPRSSDSEVSSPVTPYLSNSLFLDASREERTPPRLSMGQQIDCMLKNARSPSDISDTSAMKRHKTVPSEDSTELDVVGKFESGEPSLFRTNSFPAGGESWHHNVDAEYDDNDWFNKPSQSSVTHKEKEIALPKPRSRVDLSGLSQMLGTHGKGNPGLHRVENSSESLNDYGYDFTDERSHSSDEACCLRQVTCEKTDGSNTDSDSEFPVDELIHKFDRDASLVGGTWDQSAACGGSIIGEKSSGGHQQHSIKPRPLSNARSSLTNSTFRSSHSLSSSDSGNNIAIAITREAGATLPFEKSLESASKDFCVGSPKETSLYENPGIVLSPGGINFDNMGMSIDEDETVNLVKPSSSYPPAPKKQSGDQI